MFCSKCGKEIKGKGVKYCSFCGEPCDTTLLEEETKLFKKILIIVLVILIALIVIVGTIFYFRRNDCNKSLMESDQENIVVDDIVPGEEDSTLAESVKDDEVIIEDTEKINAEETTVEENKSDNDLLDDQKSPTECEEDEQSDILKKDEPISMVVRSEFTDQPVVENKFLFEHDKYGRITTIKQYDVDSNYIGKITQAYDEQGNCIKEYSLGFGDSISLGLRKNEWKDGLIYQSNDGYTEKYEYDDKGRQIAVRYYDNNECFMHDSFEYDVENRIHTVVRENYGGGWKELSTYFYEGENTEPYFVSIDALNENSSSSTIVYEYNYDSKGRMVYKKEMYDFGDSGWTLTWWYTYE